MPVSSWVTAGASSSEAWTSSSAGRAPGGSRLTTAARRPRREGMPGLRMTGDHQPSGAGPGFAQHGQDGDGGIEAGDRDRVGGRAQRRGDRVLGTVLHGQRLGERAEHPAEPAVGGQQVCRRRRRPAPERLPQRLGPGPEGGVMPGCLALGGPQLGDQAGGRGQGSGRCLVGCRQLGAAFVVPGDQLLVPGRAPAGPARPGCGPPPRTR